MKLLFGKSIWGMFPCETERFLDRAKADGFDAVELLLYWLPEPPAKIAQLCAERGLTLISQILTEGAGPAEHLRFLERRVRESAEIRPALINLHTGKDYFDMVDNRRLFERAAEMSAECGVGVVHETHRGRALYSAPEAEQYLRAVPGLRLCADFSHWMCVHESDLTDQPDRIERAVQRADYVHARVGFSQGPQVPHPLAPEYTAERERHVALWRRILELRRAEGRERFILTTEFGPVPYMPRLPFTGQPVADEWRVNVEFRNWLREQLI